MKFWEYQVRISRRPGEPRVQRVAVLYEQKLWRVLAGAAANRVWRRLPGWAKLGGSKANGDLTWQTRLELWVIFLRRDGRVEIQDAVAEDQTPDAWWQHITRRP